MISKDQKIAWQPLMMKGKTTQLTNKHKQAIVRIGTSNIVVPGNKQSFPPEFQLKSRLNFYASMFNTLEVNSSFYKLPMAKTFEKWSLDVPEDFQFTVKFWKEITHIKNLAIDLENIDKFLSAAEKTGSKKGCLLIQFPGKITFEYFNKVEQILERVSACDPKTEWRIAVEFRSDSWYISETYELLDEFNASLVLHDIPKGKNDQVNKTAAFVYIRYHGPAGDYRGSYSDQFLKEQAAKIKAWLKSGKDVYAYFNNTIGNAFENAMMLKKITGMYK